MISKKELDARQRRLDQMARGETFIHERLHGLRSEIDLVSHMLDRLTMPRRSRRRKSYVDKVGNLVSFPRKQT
jgi:hypothetical protein